MGGRLTRGLRAVADLFLPRVCVVCGERLNIDERHLCLHCLADLPQTRFWTMKVNPMAERLNAMIQKNLELSWGHTLTVRMEKEGYAYAAALFYYDNAACYRHIPMQIKYQGDIPAGRFFGNMLGRMLSESPWLNDVDAVIPVPLHWFRKWRRGYNQAEVIAGEVAETMGKPLRADLLKRIRYTKTQTRLDTNAKETNVAGAFRCNDRVNDKPSHILLVDDVFTTGATLSACHAALREVFPAYVRISVATLAFVGE